MFRYLILVTLFSILYFTALCIYGDHINQEINVPFTYTKVSDGNFWDITVTFDGRTTTYSQRKGKGVSGLPVLFDDGGYYIINTSGTGDVFQVRKLVPIDHEHDQPTVPRSTPIQTPASSPRAPSDPSPESSPDASSDPTPVNTGTPDPESVTLTESVVSELKVTEYMLRNWSRSGHGGLPQWIELYNPNTRPVSVNRWTLESEGRPIPITSLVIPAQQVGLIVTQRIAPRHMSGITYDRIFIMPRNSVNLRRGWILTDSNGNTVSRVLNPTLPPRKDGYRVSYQQYPSESPTEDHFYGSQHDVGSPGFYEAAAPAAPSLQRPKLAITWGHLKMEK